MAGIFAYIHTQPMSFSQKLVQTRVWAQGLTLASLLGMAFITQIPSAGDKILKEREQASDHSWQDFIGDSNTDPSVKANKSGDSNKNASGKSSKTTNANPKSEGMSSNSNDDTSGKSSRSAHPNVS